MLQPWSPKIVGFVYVLTVARGRLILQNRLQLSLSSSVYCVAKQSREKLFIPAVMACVYSYNVISAQAITHQWFQPDRPSMRGLKHSLLHSATCAPEAVYTQNLQKNRNVFNVAVGQFWDILALIVTGLLKNKQQQSEIRNLSPGWIFPINKFITVHIMIQVHLKLQPSKCKLMFTYTVSLLWPAVANIGLACVR